MGVVVLLYGRSVAVLTKTFVAYTMIRRLVALAFFLSLTKVSSYGVDNSEVVFEEWQRYTAEAMDRVKTANEHGSQSIALISMAQQYCSEAIFNKWKARQFAQMMSSALRVAYTPYMPPHTIPVIAISAPTHILRASVSPSLHIRGSDEWQRLATEAVGKIQKASQLYSEFISEVLTIQQYTYKLNFTVLKGPNHGSEVFSINSIIGEKAVRAASLLTEGLQYCFEARAAIQTAYASYTNSIGKHHFIPASSVHTYQTVPTQDSVARIPITSVSQPALTSVPVTFVS